ncbi:Sel1 domain protein repeat-containing protein [Seminavis robusta]|uniref:Sel1 domain protein repeat-containing protein n=1 Tax=Seminavis robusta TaxID=568900 RepID=A0A9N8EDF9_9STRA|nr:Sel1 domain protein repeat-containing protein [Seminavis robusta]|eukprot:Sro963_g225240.1 Sel1 domain protein repeat-containing protein (260) ;mRNA; r:4919-5698
MTPTPTLLTPSQTKSITDDLVCPISLELPWDPVVAEDGRIYDRSSIEEHFQTHAGEYLKSPMTNEKMGQKLLSAVQHRNTIDVLVESGVIGGDLAAKWNEKLQQKKELAELLKQAEAGDPVAMYDIGVCYGQGRGCKKDHEAALQWFQKAHQAGNVCGTASIGLHYLEGQVVPKCLKKGMMYITLAAGQGSDSGAYHLGLALAEGKFGMVVDKEEAIYWLEKSVGECSYMHLSSDAVAAAEKKIKNLKATTETAATDEE